MLILSIFTGVNIDLNNAYSDTEFDILAEEETQELQQELEGS